MLLPNSCLFKFKQVGFTLIELLVALSIIAVLTFVAVTSFDSLTKNARDSQRKSDLKQIQSGLEQYYRDQGFYPASSPSPLIAGVAMTNLIGNPASPAPSPQTYLKEVPGEAVDSTHPYLYVPSTTNASYCLFAEMENASNVSLTTGCSSGDYNYSVSSP